MVAWPVPAVYRRANPMRETPAYSGVSWAFAKQVTGERVCVSGMSSRAAEVCRNPKCVHLQQSGVCLTPLLSL